MKTKESFSAYRIAWVVVATLCFITVAYATNVIVWTSWKLIVGRCLVWHRQWF